MIYLAFFAGIFLGVFAGLLLAGFCALAREEKTLDEAER